MADALLNDAADPLRPCCSLAFQELCHIVGCHPALESTEEPDPAAERILELYCPRR